MTKLGAVITRRGDALAGPDVSRASSETAARARRGVLIVAANLPPLYTGGGQQAVTLAQQFRAMGRDVLFVSRRHGSLPRHGEIEGIEVHRVEYETEGRVGFFRSLAQIARLSRCFVALRHRYTVVLFFNPQGSFPNAWPAILLLRALRKKTIARMTLIGSSDPAALRQKRLGWLRLLPYRLHNRVVSISTALSKSYRTALRNDGRLVYIANGVDIRRFHPLPDSDRQRERLALGLDPDLRYVLFVGRVSFRKGIDTLVNAWSEVIHARSDARLLLVGPTVDEFRAAARDTFAATLSEEIERAGLGPYITWVGRTATPERYLQVADVFVFPSRREGCPNALLEAMACGIPIVTTRIPDITEDLVEPDREALVTPQEPRALAEGIIAALASPDAARERAERALARVRREFAIATTARKYLDVVDSL